MTLTKNAKDFFQTLHQRFCYGLIVQVDCPKDSDANRAIEELRDAGIISVEVGQVTDNDGTVLRDFFALRPLRQVNEVID